MLENQNAFAEKRTAYRWVVPFVLLASVLVSFLDRVNVSVLIVDPVFLNDMGIAGDTVRMGLLMTSFLVAYGFSNVLLSPLGDYFGPRTVMCLAIFLWAVSMLMGGVSTTFALIIASRILLGLGEGMHWPMQAKFVKNWFPSTEQGRANSIWVSGSKFGPAIAVPIFSFIVVTWGWRTSFFALAGVSFLIMALIWLLTKNYPEHCKWVNKAELEYIREGAELKPQESRENRKESLIRDFKQFVQKPSFWVLTLFYMCQCSIFFSMLTWLPAYFKTARGFSWAAMGGYTAITWVLAAGSVVLVGILSDKFGRRGPFMIIAEFGSGCLILVSALVQDNMISAWAIIFGTAFMSMGTPAAWASIGKIVPNQAVAAGAGMMNGVAIIGSAFVPTILGYFVSVSGFTGALLFLVGVATVGTCCGIFLTVKKC